MYVAMCCTVVYTSITCNACIINYILVRITSCIIYLCILGTSMEKSVLQGEITAPCNGEQIVLEFNPSLKQCTLKIQANQLLPIHTLKTLDWPVKNCHSYNLKKLSNHLIQVHGITNKAKRTKLLQKSKRVSFYSRLRYACIILLLFHIVESQKYAMIHTSIPPWLANIYTSHLISFIRLYVYYM